MLDVRKVCKQRAVHRENLSQCIETGMLFCVIPIYVRVCHHSQTHWQPFHPHTYTLNVWPRSRWTLIVCLLRGTCVQKLLDFPPWKMCSRIDYSFRHNSKAHIWLCVSAQKVRAKEACKTGCISIRQRKSEYGRVCVCLCMCIPFLVKEIRPLWNRCQTFISWFRNQYTLTYRICRTQNIHWIRVEK